MSLRTKAPKAKPTKIKKRKYQQRTVGAFVRIPLGNDTFSYARILDDASFAIYDIRTNKKEVELEYLASFPVLFIVAVYNDAVTSCHWLKVGKLPIEENLQVLPPKFIQDQLNPKKFSIYEQGQDRPATREECEGLERSAVWEPEHVEQRIRDHFAGVPNQVLMRLSIKDT